MSSSTAPKTYGRDCSIWRISSSSCPAWSAGRWDERSAIRDDRPKEFDEPSCEHGERQDEQVEDPPGNWREEVSERAEGILHRWHECGREDRDHADDDHRARRRRRAHRALRPARESQLLGRARERERETRGRDREQREPREGRAVHRAGQENRDRDRDRRQWHSVASIGPARGAARDRYDAPRYASPSIRRRRADRKAKPSGSSSGARVPGGRGRQSVTMIVALRRSPPFTEERHEQDPAEEHEERGSVGMGSRPAAARCPIAAGR